MAVTSATMGSRGNQEPLAVLSEEDRQRLAHQAMTTPASTAPVASLATTALALDSIPPMVTTIPALDLAALVAPLVAAAMAILAVPDTTTPILLQGRNLGSCKAILNF